MLLTPGPVKLTDEIRNAQSREMINHRGKEFEEIFGDVVSRLKTLLDAEEVYILTGSGTLGVESILANACKKDETILCLNNGEFGKRFADIARIYARVQEEKLEQGKGWSLERVKGIIDGSNATVLGMVHNDTSTGVTNQVREICNYAKKKGMITVVDGISAWPAMEMKMKDFGADFIALGSQKAIGAPPGLVMVGVSKKGVERFAGNTVPNYYCDFKKYKRFSDEKKQTPFTPAVSTLFALQEALNEVEKNGLDATIKRHAEGAKHTREAVKKLGFRLFAEEGFYSNSVTAFHCDKSDEIKKALNDRYDIEIAGGMGELKGKILRIAHLGNFATKDLDYCFSALKEIIG